MFALPTIFLLTFYSLIRCQDESLCQECTETRKKFYCPKIYVSPYTPHCFETEKDCKARCGLKCLTSPSMCGCSVCLTGTNSSYCPDPENSLPCFDTLTDCTTFCTAPCLTQTCDSSLVFPGVKLHVDMTDYYSAGWRKIHQSNYTQPFYLPQIKAKYFLVGCGNMKASPNVLDVAAVVRVADIKKTNPPSQSFSSKVTGIDSDPVVYWYNDFPVEGKAPKQGAFGFSSRPEIKRESCDTIDGVEKLCFSVSLSDPEVALAGYRCGNWNVKIDPPPVRIGDYSRWIFAI